MTVESRSGAIRTQVFTVHTVGCFIPLGEESPTTTGVVFVLLTGLSSDTTVELAFSRELRLIALASEVLDELMLNKTELALQMDSFVEELIYF